MIKVACALIYSEIGLLLAQRKDNEKWEFPGGKLEIGETVDQCIVREIEEEFNIHVEPKKIVGTIKFNGYELIFIECDLSNSIEMTCLKDHINICWINAMSEFDALNAELLEADQLFIEKFRYKLRVP